MTDANKAPRPHIYRPDIDGLRAIAVLGVIGFHAFAEIVPGGFIGVDIFFVISGYLISGIILENLDKDTFSFGDFYARRARRIFPALIVVVATTVAAGWFLLMADEYKALGKNTVAGALFLSNFSLWKESGYFDIAAKLKPLLHLWSLGVEEQFYILWPFFLFLAMRQKLNLFEYIVAIATASFLVNILRIESDPAATFFLPASRFWELMCGSLLACHDRERTDESILLDKSYLQNLVSIGGIIVLAVSFFFIDESMPYPGWRAACPVLGAVLIIAAGPEAFINRFVLGNRVFVFVGLISYPLYLWHWPLLSYSQIIYSGCPPLDVTLALVAATFPLAWLTYECVEKTSRLAFSRKPEQTTFVLSGLMITLVIAGTVIWKENGFTFRFPTLAAFDTFAASETSQNWQRDRCFVFPNSPIDGPDAFEKYNCVPPREIGKFLILLVGDSHAADLYPGLTAAFSKKATIGQLTSGFCVPMIKDVQIVNMKDGTERCREINSYIFAKIREMKPDVLVIGGNYYAYASDKAWRYPDYISSMMKDINALEASGISVVIAGQTPTWTAPLPKIVEQIIAHKQNVPQRMETGLDKASLALDRRMQKLPWNTNVTYVSLADRLCGDDGCLVATGANLPDDLVFIDQGHYSENGSRYVVSSILSSVIDEKLQVKSQKR